MHVPGTALLGALIVGWADPNLLVVYRKRSVDWHEG